MNITHSHNHEQEYQEFKIRLQEMKQKKQVLYKYAYFASFVLTALGTLFSLSTLFHYEATVIHILISIIIGSLIGILLILFYNIYFEIKENALRKEIFICESEAIKENIKADIFEHSIKMSYKYLDQYYLQIREQAQRGFLVTLSVSVFGAILLGIGILAMFLGHTDPSYITCASGVITEFIAAVFFYLYNKTISSMSKYHNKLVLSQNVSIALKVSDSLPDQDKVNAKNMIINELIKDVNTHLITSNAPDDNNA